MSKNEKVAFIGLGQMGIPMAKILLDKGFEVSGFDLSDAARASLKEAGGTVSDTVHDACKEANIVVTMLPNGSFVRQALLGSAGQDLAVIVGSLVIDMSSCSPSDTIALEADLNKLGVRLIDAPVLGGVQRAESGTLSFMVGGSPSDIEEALPVLSALGTTITKTGKIASGHAMKALYNFVSAASAMTSMEVVLVGKEFGLDPNIIIDVLNVSTGNNNAMESNLKQFVNSGTFDLGVGLSLMAKDIRVAASLSQKVDLNALKLVDLSRMWTEAEIELGSKSDHTEIYKLVETHSK